tara:strand:- start:392 stop:12208 length:11817 start_codon:yes stop_codon:yes gene_type:complete
MAVNLNTNSLLDYLKSIPGFKDACSTATCFEERKELYEQYCDDLGYHSCADPNGQYYYTGLAWQNTKLLDLLKTQSPPFHETFKSTSNSSSAQGNTRHKNVSPSQFTKEDLFITLRNYIANSEGGPGRYGGVDQTYNDGNIIDDYHLGYFQISGKNINTYLRYLQKYIVQPGATPSPQDIKYQEAIDEWHSLIFENAYEELKFSMDGNKECSLFPTVLNVPEQTFLHCLHIADAVHGKPSHTFENLVLQNITGKHGYLGSKGSVQPWSLSNIHTNIYVNNPNLKAVTAFDYLQWSGIDTIPKKCTTQEEFDKIFTTGVTRKAVYESVIYHAKKAYNDTQSRLHKYFPESAIDNYFSQKNLNDLYLCSEKYQIYGIDTLFSNINQNNTTLATVNNVVPSASTSSYSSPNKVTAAALSTVVNADVQKRYSEVSVDPLLYKYGIGAEETGLTYIGDILMAVPPVSLRYSEHNQSTAIDTLRTSGDPLFTYNNTIPRIDMTLMFNGARAINEQLRPLVAMFHRMPFSTIQNHSVWDMWIGRRESFNTDLKTNPAGSLLNRFAPIPVYLESINVSTIPGFPNSVQAHISVVRMNRSPYGVSARMWKYWEDAMAETKLKTVRTARDSTIWSTDRDEKNEVDKIYIVDSAMKNHIIELEDGASTGNKNMDETLTTKYPQESVPYKYQYRNLLWDDGYPNNLVLSGSNTLGKNIYGNNKDPLIHWPVYREEHNRDLFLTYKSARKFSDKLSIFKQRLKELTENYRKIQTLSAQISTMSLTDLLDVYKPITEMTLKDTSQLLIDSMSAVKVGKDFSDNINAAFKNIALELTQDSAGNQLPIFTDIVNYCDKYLDSNGNVIKDEQTCAAEGGTWQTSGTPGFRSPVPPYDFIPVPLASTDENDFIYVDANGEITNSFEVFLDWLNDANRAVGICEEDPTYVTKKSCKDAKYTWNAQPNSDEKRIALWEKNNAIYSAFYDNMVNDPLGLLGLEDIGSKWNYDTAGIQLSWITDTDDLLSYKEDIDSLVKDDQHKPTKNNRASFPYFYHFQSVVQSVNYSFTNQVVPLFTASSNLPSYQHMGISNPTVSIVLRTRDERIHKALTDMRETVQEIGNQTLAGNTKLVGLGTVDVSGNILGHSSDRKDKRNQALNLPGSSGSLSGNLLNSLGFSQSSVQNLTSRTLEGFPGWWEISLDLIADTQNIRIIENLSAVTVEKIPDGINSLMDSVFPAYKANWGLLTLYQNAANKEEFLKDKLKRLDEIKAEREAVEKRVEDLPNTIWYKYTDLGICQDWGRAARGWNYDSDFDEQPVRDDYYNGSRIIDKITKEEYNACAKEGINCEGLNLGQSCDAMDYNCQRTMHEALEMPGLTIDWDAYDRAIENREDPNQPYAPSPWLVAAKFDDSPEDAGGEPSYCAATDEYGVGFFECSMAGRIHHPEGDNDTDACHAIKDQYMQIDATTDPIRNKDTFDFMEVDLWDVCKDKSGNEVTDGFRWLHNGSKLGNYYPNGICWGGDVNGWAGDTPTECESGDGSKYWVGTSTLVHDPNEPDKGSSGGYKLVCPNGDKISTFFEPQLIRQIDITGFPIIQSQAICEDPWQDGSGRDAGLWIPASTPGICTLDKLEDVAIKYTEDDNNWGNFQAYTYHNFSSLTPLVGVNSFTECCQANNSTNSAKEAGKCYAYFNTYTERKAPETIFPMTQTKITDEMAEKQRKTCLEWIGLGVDAKVGTGPKPNRKLINNEWTQEWFEWGTSHNDSLFYSKPDYITVDRGDVALKQELENSLRDLTEEEVAVNADINAINQQVSSIVDHLILGEGEALVIYINPELDDILIQITGNKLTSAQLYGIAEDRGDLYQKLFQPVLDEMVLWLQRLKGWELDKMKNYPNWTDEHPREFQLTATLATYYIDFLKNCIYTISGIANSDYGKDLLTTPGKAVSLFPGYSRAAVEAQKLAVDQPSVILQSIILGSQLRVVFYNLLRRSDFRTFLDEQVVPRNKAIKTLKDALKRELLSIQVGTAQIVYNVSAPNVEEAKKSIENAIYLIENSEEFLDTSNVSTSNEYQDFIKNLNSKIQVNHPDLGLPREYLNETGHAAVGPGYPFVDDDLDLELIEMSKMADNVKMQTFSQLAAITSGKFSDYYLDLVQYLGHYKGTCYISNITAESCASMIDGTHKDVQEGGKWDMFASGRWDGSRDDGVQDTPGWCIVETLVDQEPLNHFSCEIAGWQFDYDSFVPKGDGKDVNNLNKLLKGSFTGDDNLDFVLPAAISNADRNALDIPKMLMSFKELAKREKEIAANLPKGADTFAGSTQAAPTKKAIMDLMATTAMLDYLLMLMFGAAYMENLNLDPENKTFPSNQLEIDIKNLAEKTLKEMKNLKMDTTKYSTLLAQTMALPYSEDLDMSAKGHDVAVALSQQILEKRKAAADIATISATGNYQAFLNYFGIGNIESVQRSYELKSKFNNYLQNKDRASMDRAFPAYKLFFIEQDQYSWQAFDDFYTYDAVNEITIVDSKHAASKTASIKLSNVTNKLTNDIGIGIMNEGAAITPGALLRLKVGTPVMLMIGYGADYRQLRMVFRGAVTEMKTGPILELTCQSWGAGLLNSVGAGEGVAYSTFSGPTTLGASVIDILAQTPGLSGLGRWEMRDESLNNPNNIAESTLKNAWWARALNTFSGTMGDYIKLDNNISDIIGTFSGDSGLPTTADDIAEGIRENNVIYKSVGNSLFDNIIINDKNPNGYGFYNFYSRGLGYLSDVYSKKSFKWFVVRQTCWDALHEVALFLGDYIITTRPYNEGNDILNQAPRDTLYFGPREGMYRAKSFVPKINAEYEMQKLAELVKSSAMPTKQILQDIPGKSGPGIYTTIVDKNALKLMSEEARNKVYEDDWDLENKLLDFGKTALSRILDHHIDTGDMPGGGQYPSLNNNYFTRIQEYTGTNCDGDPNNYGPVFYGKVYNNKNLINNFAHSLFLNGFYHTAIHFDQSTIVRRPERVSDEEWHGGMDENYNMQTLATDPDGYYRIGNDYSYTDSKIVGKHKANYTHMCYDKMWKSAFAEMLNFGQNGHAPFGLVKQILLNDWEQRYNFPGKSYQTFNYSQDEWNNIIKPISQGKWFDPKSYQYQDSEGEWYQGIYKYGVDSSNTLWGLLDDRPDDGRVWGTKDQPEMETRHWDNWDDGSGDSAIYSLVPWLFAGYSVMGSTGGGLFSADVVGLSTGGPEYDQGSVFDNSTYWLARLTRTPLKSTGYLSYEHARDDTLWTQIQEHHFVDPTGRGERTAIDRKIIDDVRALILNYTDVMKNQQKTYDQWISSEGLRGTSALEGNPWALDLQQALAVSGGFRNSFAFRPVIDTHAVNSYEDIVDNSIVATTDQMYNHVEVLYADEADPEASVTNAKFKTQAYISYDQDPDYLRTYQSYQKNINPSDWYDMSEADSHISAMSQGGRYRPEGGRISRAMGLTQHRVAQQILMNQMRPMYQGTMTLVGNPHIRSWDIVHIHDDSIGMYGPVEVEQVVHHLSPTGGFTTTIIPNLLVYYRSASASIDSVVMNIHSAITVMNYFFIVAKHAAMALGVLGMTQPLISSGAFGTVGFRALPFIGTGLNRLNRRTMKWNKAIDLFEKASVDDILKEKDIARKYLKKSEFVELEDLASKKKAQTTKLNLVRNQCHVRIKYANVVHQLSPAADDLRELDRLLTQKNAGNKGKAHSVKIRRLEDKIARTLGKGDMTLGRARLTKLTSGKLDNALASVDDVIKVFGEIDPDNKDLKNLKNLQTTIQNQKKELDDLIKKRKAGNKVGQKSRFKSLGNSIKTKRDALAKNLIRFDKQSELLRSGMKNKINKEINRSTTGIIKNRAKALGKRKAAAKMAGKWIPILGQAWAIYDVAKMGTEVFSATAQSKIFMTGLLAGENQLVWLPLEYQGKEYVAGLEGIIGTPRAVDTILYGELTGDLSNNNRGMLVMNMLAKFKQSEEL